MFRAAKITTEKYSLLKSGRGLRTLHTKAEEEEEGGGKSDGEQREVHDVAQGGCTSASACSAIRASDRLGDAIEVSEVAVGEERGRKKPADSGRFRVHRLLSTAQIGRSQRRFVRVSAVSSQKGAGNHAQIESAARRQTLSLSPRTIEPPLPVRIDTL